MDAATFVKSARTKAKLTQRQLAARSGIPQPTIAKIESGAQSPRFDTVVRLLDAAGHVLLPLQTREENADGIDLSLLRENLRRTPAERARRAAAAAHAFDRMRRARIVSLPA